MQRLLVLGLIVVVVAGLGAVGVIWWTTPGPPKYEYAENPEAAFKDNAVSNVQVANDALDLDFVDHGGRPIHLGDYRESKNVVLVFMRGMTTDPGGVCPTCSAQTSRFIANHAEFVRRGAKLLVVFPGSIAQVTQYVEQTKKKENLSTIPFPILFDAGFKAVDRLGIRGDVAKPSTYIMDKEGQVRFAYVGATSADRPSLASLYQQLDALEPAKKLEPVGKSEPTKKSP